MEDELMQDIIDRLDPTFGKIIDCESGWFALINELHSKLMLVDDNYRIFQIKEKFGGLRFYYSCSSPIHEEAMRKVVSTYEKISYLTCEKSGKPGQLMKKNGIYKTLHSSYQEDGWVPQEMGQ
jgi:hypothetical protein